MLFKARGVSTDQNNNPVISRWPALPSEPQSMKSSEKCNFFYLILFISSPYKTFNSSWRRFLASKLILPNLAWEFLKDTKLSCIFSSSRSTTEKAWNVSVHCHFINILSWQANVRSDDQRRKMAAFVSISLLAKAFFPAVQYVWWRMLVLRWEVMKILFLTSYPERVSKVKISDWICAVFGSGI